MINHWEDMGRLKKCIPNVDGRTDGQTTDDGRTDDGRTDTQTDEHDDISPPFQVS